jgi:hypothetical protein
MPQYSFLPFLQPFPIATRILTGLLITLSLGQVLLTGLNARFREQEGRSFEGINENAEVPYLLCVPGAALPWYFWTFLTAGFVEIKPIEVSVYPLHLTSRFVFMLTDQQLFISSSPLYISLHKPSPHAANPRSS